MQWIETENNTGKRWPKWQRTAAISDDGVVFVPGGMLGNESEVLLCAGYDGVPMAIHLKHLYVPAQWMAKEFPKSAEVCELIERKVKEHVNHIK